MASTTPRPAGRAPGILWAAPDHARLVLAALAVAEADGRSFAAPLLQDGALLDHLLRGSVDADYPASGGYVLHLYHFHHPWTHRGYLNVCTSAGAVVDTLFGDALDLWGERRRPEALYELGRATHLLADAWIPHHAAGVAGCGHGEYERWLETGDRWRAYLPGEGGWYRWQEAYPPEGGGPPHVVDWRQPADWVDRSSHESWPWFRCCLNACEHDDVAAAFPGAAGELVPGAVRQLAGFLDLFFGWAAAGRGGGER